MGDCQLSCSIKGQEADKVAVPTYMDNIENGKRLFSFKARCPHQNPACSKGNYSKSCTGYHSQ
jgi:hypothetical protein